MAHTISFQYMDPDDDAPRAGYNITDQELTITEGAHVPRVGEFVQIVTATSADSFEVIGVHTRIVMLDGHAPGWHTYVTVQSDAFSPDSRLTYIRE